jgi:hypothetical protein
LKLFAEPVGSRLRLAYLVGATALIALSLLTIVGRASADQVYWVNSNSIAYSQLDDSGGGFLPPSVFAIHNGEGAAIDTANGRIYVSEEATDQIVWFGLDGVGSGVVNTPAGTVDHPVNIAIDPETQTLYWANDQAPGSIGFAYVNETGGGLLAQPGSTDADVQRPARIAIDTLHNRVYWWNQLSQEFSWVTTNGLIGGNLSTPGLALGEPEKMGGIAIEPYSTPEELYFVDNEAGGIFHTDPLLGGEPEEIQGAYTKNNAFEPTGLAFDLTDEKFYWANQAVDSSPDEAIGTATVFGHPGTISVFPEAPVHDPAFAAILKVPKAAGQPQVSVSGTTLSCTLGEWEGDHPGASVYAAPTSYGYQWRKGSTPIGGATGSSFTATETGGYSCEVVAENAAGEAGDTSKSTTLTFPAPPKTTTPPASKKASASKPDSASKSGAVGTKLASSKPVKVKAGGTAAIAVDLTNSGRTAAGSTKVCGKLGKQAKKGLKTPACVTVKSVAAGKTAVATLKVKTLASANGTYKLTVSISGATNTSLTARVQVTRSKSKR